jgi:hypothetical protein
MLTRLFCRILQSKAPGTGVNEFALPFAIGRGLSSICEEITLLFATRNSPGSDLFSRRCGGICSVLFPSEDGRLEAAMFKDAQLVKHSTRKMNISMKSLRHGYIENTWEEGLQDALI